MSANPRWRPNTKICPHAPEALQATVKIKQEGTRTVSFFGNAIICLSCYHLHDLFDKAKHIFITVFDAILTGTPAKRSEITVFVWEPDRK